MWQEKDLEQNLSFWDCDPAQYLMSDNLFPLIKVLWLEHFEHQFSNPEETALMETCFKLKRKYWYCLFSNLWRFNEPWLDNLINLNYGPAEAATSRTNGQIGCGCAPSNDYCSFCDVGSGLICSAAGPFCEFYSFSVTFPTLWRGVRHTEWKPEQRWDHFVFCICCFH